MLRTYSFTPSGRSVLKVTWSIHDRLHHSAFNIAEHADMLALKEHDANHVLRRIDPEVRFSRAEGSVPTKRAGPNLIADRGWIVDDLHA